MIRATTNLLAPVVAVAILAFVAQAEPEGRAVAPSIATLRLAGKLDQARLEVEAALRRQDLTASHEIALRLESAKIHDRIGLHRNTRPVEAALQEIERAEALSATVDVATRGSVLAAKANYYYRAEMRGREFTKATQYAREAIDLLREASDVRAQSDAVHQLGLIHLQRRDFDRARELFDESLALDGAAGERAWMRGEYHRHVGFIDMFQGDWESALPHFESSLRFRKEAGAIDASLFAAISLGRALMETGTPEAAEPHLQYAIEIAGSIPSPVGTARASMVSGAMYEQLGAHTKARIAYQAAHAAATSVGYTMLITRAKQALQRLGRDDR